MEGVQHDHFLGFRPRRVAKVSGSTTSFTHQNIRGRPGSSGRQVPLENLLLRYHVIGQKDGRPADAAFVLAQDPVVITTLVLPTGTKGVPYEAILESRGGIELPLTWSTGARILPPGLSLNPSTGTISGTPNTSGKFKFGLKLQDSQAPNPGMAGAVFTIEIFDIEGGS